MAVPPPSPWQRGLHESSPYLGLAWQILSAMAVFGGGGFWLDRRFGWSPWGLLVGMGVSFVAIGAVLYRVLKQSNAATARRNYASLRTPTAGALSPDAPTGSDAPITPSPSGSEARKSVADGSPEGPA